MSRPVVVDDTDPNIQYSGPWFADSSGSQDNVGNFGPAYQSTLHGTTLNASLSYNFSGTQVSVWGSNNLRNDSGVLDPTWECFVDHISIGAAAPFQFAENNWLFCQQNTLVDGPHVLTVNATVMKSQTFWFDEIQYLPSATVPSDNKTILIDNLDPALQSAYGSGWVALGSTANMTTQTNSFFTFNFTGVSLSWYGFIPTELSHNATTATYSVDGKTPVSFPLKGLSAANSATIYNQKFFQTEQLEQGEHRILVLYQGSGQTTPLTLDYLLVQNGSTPATTPTSAPASATTSNSVTQSKGKSDIGAIVGGVVGGLALIIIAILGYLYLRRRERRIILDEKEKGLSASTLDPQPFIYSPLPIERSVLDGYVGKPSQHQQSVVQTAARNGGHGHNQMPSFSATDASQSVNPPSTGSGLTFPSNANTAGHERTTSDTSNPIHGLYATGGSRTQRQANNISAYASPSSGTSSSTRSEKERLEAAATAAALRPLQRGDGLPSPPASDTSGSTSSRFVMHQDSGLRLNSNIAAQTIEEIPPQYTAG